MSSNDTKDCPEGDVLCPGPTLADGQRPFIRHTADHQIQVGLMRQAKDGEALHGNVFHLSETTKKGLYAVDETQVPGAAAPSTSEAHGPAKVNSRDYRNGWDRIFGKAVVGQA